MSVINNTHCYFENLICNLFTKEHTGNLHKTSTRILASTRGAIPLSASHSYMPASCLVTSFKISSELESLIAKGTKFIVLAFYLYFLTPEHEKVTRLQ